MFDLEEELKKLPGSPGVYLMHNDRDEIIYIGKAINLKNRVRPVSYTHLNELVDELNELKLSTMAATLDDLYHKPGFIEMDNLTLIAELIGPQFQEKVSTTLKNRLTAAHLKGSPEELADCVDSDKREYQMCIRDRHYALLQILLVNMFQQLRECC